VPRKKAGWSYSAGEKGRNRVRVFERPDRPGQYQLVCRAVDPETGVTKMRKFALQCVDRSDAKRQCDAMAGKATPVPQKRTLSMLVTRYLAETHSYRTAAQAQHHARSILTLFAGFIGRDRDPAKLDRGDFDRYTQARRQGAIFPGKKRRGLSMRSQTIKCDLHAITAMFNWAMTVRDASNQPLLASNPFRGFKLSQKDDTRRPRLTFDDYQAMRRGAPGVHALCELALILAWETGHRINAIRCLRWSDVDFKARTITWRAEHDKTRHQHTTPLSDTACDALTAYRTQCAILGDANLFALDGDVVSRIKIGRWWRICEDRADIGHAAHRGWHSCRRGFATELKGASLKDVAALGGWRSTQVLLNIYTQADQDAMRAALAGRRSVATPPTTETSVRSIASGGTRHG
jgi:integrase